MHCPRLLCHDFQALFWLVSEPASADFHELPLRCGWRLESCAGGCRCAALYSVLRGALGDPDTDLLDITEDAKYRDPADDVLVPDEFGGCDE